MNKLSNLILDSYDDLEGIVLHSVIQDAGGIPPLIKQAHRLTVEEIDSLPDYNFALVLLDEGRKMKKYATIDAGNTVLSVLYLLKQASLLPPGSAQTAASRLVDACTKFGLPIPDDLHKMASPGAEYGVSGESQSFYASDTVDTTEPIAGTSKNKKVSKNKPVLGKDTDDIDLSMRTNINSTDQGINHFKTPIWTPRERWGEASLEKGAGHYVDVSNWTPTVEKMHITADNTLLNGRYPVDSYDQIKTAAEYFSENWRQFAPRDRREYCVKLASRMEEVGMDTPADVSKYSSDEYSPRAASMARYRRDLVPEEFHPALDTLIDKMAYVKPHTFAEALEEFDNLSGLNWEWDSLVPDPWVSTFGVDKTASATYTFDGNGVRTDGDEIRDLALNGRDMVEKQFGVKFADEFSSSPVDFFDALPVPQKLVLGRLSSDRHISARE